MKKQLKESQFKFSFTSGESSGLRKWYIFFTHEICNHSLLKVFLYWCAHAPEGLSCSCLHIKKLAAFLFPRIMIVNNVRKPYGANTAVVKPISSSPWHLRDYAIFSSAFADSPKKSADLSHPRQANRGVI